MKSEWRTSAVVGLCESIRESQDYSTTPILADALEESGCDDLKLLSDLRSLNDLITSQRLVAEVYSNDSSCAVEDIKTICEEIGPRALVEEGDGYDEETEFTYERLMRAAERYLNGLNSKHGYGEYTVEHGSETLQDEFQRYASRFWKLYALVTGLKTSEMNDSFFSCTC